jgi:ABC-type proline/glycine betaine transport system permease subunit
MRDRERCVITRSALDLRLMGNRDRWDYCMDTLDLVCFCAIIQAYVDERA